MAYALDLQDKEELKALLSPIDKARPTGDNLQYDTLFDAIRAARREEDERLPQGVWKKEVKVADWRKVADLAKGGLLTRTKDLQLAGWLVEAWVLNDGIKGLDKGVKLLHGLVDQYWETLYPPLDAEDAEYRFGILNWCNDVLPERIQRAPISQPDGAIDPSGKKYTLQDWVDANYLETLSKREGGAVILEKALSEGRPTLEQVRSSMDHTPDSFFEDLSAGTRSVMDSLDRFEEALNVQVADAPSFHKMHSVLESLNVLAETALAERRQRHAAMKQAEKQEKESRKAESKSKPTEKGEQGAKTVSTSSEAPSRDKAYEQLLAIANYLEHIEPQSPAPHLIRRAVEWGNMSSAEFFSELAQANCDIQAIVRILGLNK